MKIDEQFEPFNKFFKVSEFFKKEPPETATPERVERIREKLFPILRDLRFALNAPVKITSCYRSPEHNAQIGGKEGSHHLFEADRCAVDFTTEDLDAAWLWIRAHCGLFCYSYVDWNRNFIHVSSRTKTDPRVGQTWELGTSRPEEKK